MLTRNDYIRGSLEAMQGDGVIKGFYSYAPGDSKGTRWVIETAAIATLVCSTREVEAFIQGVKAVQFA